MFDRTNTRKPAASQAEAILQNYFATHGVPFNPQYTVHRGFGFANRYRSGDIFLPLINTIVLVDGSPWHRNPEDRASEEMFYRANGLLIARIPSKDITDAAARDKGGESDQVRNVINKYIPQSISGAAAPAVKTYYTPLYGQGRADIGERRRYTKW